MTESLLKRWMTSRRLRRYERLVREVHTIQPGFRSLSGKQLQAERLSLSLQIRSGEKLQRVIARSFALVREAARRSVGMEHFDVQLLGGCAMAEGRIAEMATGEGKTLTASLPLFLFALFERGAHLVTANDYLAERDANLMRPIFETLGLRVGFVVQASGDAERAAAYRDDITYGTLRELAFDFLRDRLKRSSSNVPASTGETNSEAASRMGSPCFLLVDEADSLLIDEARTPLIISLPSNHNPALREPCFRWAAQVAPHFEQNRDYELDPVSRRVQLTPPGRLRLRNALPAGRLTEITLPEADEAVCRAITARDSFRKNEDYVVKDGQIVLIDGFTGRIAAGRQLRDGMHQALEAHEGLRVSCAQEPAARVTVKEFASRYLHLAGMTGTAAEVSRELQTHYGTRVVPIPTHRPCRRVILPVRIFATCREKYLAIVESVRTLTTQGRPILIGTRTIQQSLDLSEVLNAAQLEHALLNGVQDRDEAEIVSRAGQPACITVATNMAGRGTDIHLTDDVRAAGGLHVIGTELHESARIDRQLAGRSARQGDPGSFEQLASFEDSLLAEAWGSAVAAELLASAERGFELSYAISLFKRAQWDLEQRQRRQRTLLVEMERRRQLRNREMGRDPWLDDLV